LNKPWNMAVPQPKSLSSAAKCGVSRLDWLFHTEPNIYSENE